MVCLIFLPSCAWKDTITYSRADTLHDVFNITVCARIDVEHRWFNSVRPGSPCDEFPLFELLYMHFNTVTIDMACKNQNAALNKGKTAQWIRCLSKRFIVPPHAKGSCSRDLEHLAPCNSSSYPSIKWLRLSWGAVVQDEHTVMQYWNPHWKTKINLAGFWRVKAELNDCGTYTAFIIVRNFRSPPWPSNTTYIKLRERGVEFS